MPSPPPPTSLAPDAPRPGSVAVQLTAAGVGAIGVILVAGGNPSSVIQRVALSPKAPALAPGQFTRTTLAGIAGASGQERRVLDDALIVRTALDRFELHLHGGTAVMAAVLDALRSAGSEVLSLVEAQRRGVFGPGIEGELQVALSRAMTQTALQILLDQPRIQRAWAAHWLARVQGAGGQSLWPLHSAAQWLLQRSHTLLQLLTPPRVAIIGPPNAGKSTLANALLGRPLSITSELAGTTRDWVDAQAIFSAGPPADPIHVAITLVDTAGVRQSPDPIERESIDRAHQQAAAADGIIALFDATRPPRPDELALLQTYRRRPLVMAINKVDVLKDLSLPLAFAAFPALQISAQLHQGLEPLMAAVLEQLDLHVLSQEPFAFTPRQVGVLQKLSLEDDLSRVTALLAELTGPPPAAP